MSRSLNDLSYRFKPTVFEFLARCTEAGVPLLIVDTLSRAETKNVGTTASLMSDLPAAIITGGLGAAVGGVPMAGATMMAGVAIKELVKTAAWNSASVPARQMAIRLIQAGDMTGAIRALTAGGASVAFAPNNKGGT